MNPTFLHTHGEMFRGWWQASYARGKSSTVCQSTLGMFLSMYKNREIQDIRKGGGVVKGAVLLVNAGRLKQLVPDKRMLKKLKERYPNEIAELFGIEVDALTANEAEYLIGFRTIDEIRNRLAKAQKETDIRLRSKRIK